MRILLFSLAITSCCMLGLFLVGVSFYLCIEVFFYFYGGIPISFELLHFEKIFKMSIWGGGISGVSIILFRLLKVKGF